MLSEKEVRKILSQVRTSKSIAKLHGTDESYRVNCRVEKIVKKILEIKNGKRK